MRCHARSKWCRSKNSLRQHRMPGKAHLTRTLGASVIVGLGLTSLPIPDAQRQEGLWRIRRHRLRLGCPPKWAHPSRRSRSRLPGPGPRAPTTPNQAVATPCQSNMEKGDTCDERRQQSLAPQYLMSCEEPQEPGKKGLCKGRLDSEPIETIHMEVFRDRHAALSFGGLLVGKRPTTLA
jgi:hypothetical protein